MYAPPPRPRPVPVVGCVVLLLLSVGGGAHAGPPPGQSALLNGMHDAEAGSWLAATTPGCDKGWLTSLQYIGDSGVAGPDCYRGLTDQGISIIQRLDLDGSQSFPKDAARIEGYARTFADFVGKCDNVHVWVVGNEPNVTYEKSDPDCSTPRYVETYAAVHAAVHALPGRGADLVLVAPNSPYSPGCLHSLRSIIDGLEARGVTPDGFALHAYTRADSAASLSAGLVSDPATQTDNTIDECAGPAAWSDSWHSHLWIYRDYVAVIEAALGPGKPVFVTESGNACEVKSGNDCYPDADIGYFQALYADVAAYNQDPATKTPIRAITPYRWTGGDDGTGRDFEIGKRPKLQADLAQAFAKRYAWTEPSCGGGGGGCPTGDGDCGEGQRCRLSDLVCVATTPCGAGEACGAGEICRRDSGDCVPAERGTADIEIAPASPGPGAAIELTAVAEPGYTHVHITLEGPAGPIAAGPMTHEKVGGLHRWTWPATLGGAGTYRATFTADPNEKTIYALRTFNAPAEAPTPPEVLDGGPALAGDKPDLASPAEPGRPDLVDGACGLAGGDAGGAPSAMTLLLLGALLWVRRRR